MHSAALSSDRVIKPNVLPDFKWEKTSFGMGRTLSMRQSANPLQGNAGMDSISVRFVADTGQVLSVAMALVPDPSQPVGTGNHVAICEGGACTGVTVDTATGKVNFADTLLGPTILSGVQQTATLKGTYVLPDWHPRSGTTVNGATLAACVLPNKAINAEFADIGCLNGTYVGTGIDGQACMVQIDTSAKSFRFDDGVNNKTFDFSASGGYTNLGTYHSQLTQSVTISRPGVPQETISFTASPIAAAPGFIAVDLVNLHSIGGTLNSVYYRTCRIEFDNRMP